MTQSRSPVLKTRELARCVERTGKECNDCVECLSRHPERKTCNDCQHITRCRALIAVTGGESYCDWYPSRFRETP